MGGFCGSEEDVTRTWGARGCITNGFSLLRERSSVEGADKRLSRVCDGRTADRPLRRYFRSLRAAPTLWLQVPYPISRMDLTNAYGSSLSFAASPAEAPSTASSALSSTALPPG